MTLLQIEESTYIYIYTSNVCIYVNMQSHVYKYVMSFCKWGTTIVKSSPDINIMLQNVVHKQNIQETNMYANINNAISRLLIFIYVLRSSSFIRFAPLHRLSATRRHYSTPSKKELQTQLLHHFLRPHTTPSLAKTISE